MWKGIYGIFGNISYSNIIDKTRYKKLELTKTLNITAIMISVSQK